MRLCVGTSKGVVLLDADRNTPVAVSAVPATVTCLAQSSGDPALIYAGSSEPEGSGGAVLFRSRDGGRNWTDITPRQARGEGVWALATPPEAPAQVWFGNSRGQVFQSLDYGSRFRECAALAAARVRGAHKGRDTCVCAIVFAPPPAREMFVAIRASGIFRSPDRGAAFDACSHKSVSDPLGVAVDPASAQRLFATTAQGFFRSQDGGESWEAVALDRYYFHPVLADRDGLVYTAGAAGPPSTWLIGEGADAALYLSVDRGHSFSSFGDAAGPRRGMIVAIVSSPWCPEERFATTTDGAVLRWRAREEEVRIIAENLPAAYALAVMP